MGRRPSVAALYGQEVDGEDLLAVDTTPEVCEPAQAFAAVADALVNKALAEPDLALINQTRLELQELFLVHYIHLPLIHQRHVRERQKTCVLDVYLECLDKLTKADQDIAPRLLPRHEQAIDEHTKQQVNALVLAGVQGGPV